MNGILNLNKPNGITSHDCVARVRRAAKIKRVGHAGTLDPMATGVLLLCIGQATRLSEYLMGGRKVYRAEITFGAATDTQDSTGRVVTERDASALAREELERVLPPFTGEVLQIPPMVSALHHEGKRLYELARQGVEVEREPRKINVYRLEVLDFIGGERPRAEVEVECSAGTYIRTLAHDLGEAVGTGAHMSVLERRAVGGFGIGEAVTIEEAEERARTGALDTLLFPMRRAFPESPMISLDQGQVEWVRNGRALHWDLTPSPDGSDPVVLLSPSGEVFALARWGEGCLHPFKVLSSP